MDRVTRFSIREEKIEAEGSVASKDLQIVQTVVAVKFIREIKFESAILSQFLDIIC